MEAQDLLQRGRSTMWGPTKNQAVFERATELLRRSIEKDPHYANAYAALADVLVLDYINRWTADPEWSLAEAGGWPNELFYWPPGWPTVTSRCPLLL